MIRYSLLVLFIFAVCTYSLRDWYKALCCLVPLLAVLERPDMPRTMLGIPGFNPFNIILAFTMLGMFLQRDKEPLVPAIPKRYITLFVIYCIALIVAFLRMYVDRSGMNELSDFMGMQRFGDSDLIMNDLINVLKWVVPGVMMAYGTNSPERVRWGIYSILAMGALFGLQIVVKMAPALIGGDDLGARALRVMDRDLGYQRVMAAAVMAMASVAFFVVAVRTERGWERLLMFGGFLGTALALALTGGRAGLGAWAVAVFVLGVLRWRMTLVIGPLFAVLAVPVVPGLQERILVGFTEETQSHRAVLDDSGRDLSAMTSGRVHVWPRVIDKIGEAPLFGQGKRGMLNSGIAISLADLYGKHIEFGHPHNAYLELFLDMGFVGGIPILALYIMFGLLALRTYRNKENRELSMVGGICLGMLMVQAVAGLGSQSFYFKQGAVIMFCAMGMLVAVVYGKVLEAPAAETEAPPERKVYGLKARLARQAAMTDRAARPWHRSAPQARWRT